MYGLSCLPCLNSSYPVPLSPHSIIYPLPSSDSHPTTPFYFIHADYYQTPPTTPTTMFRQLCLLAVAFLAVADARNNEPKSIKDSKSVKSSNKKTKATTLCADVKTMVDMDKEKAKKGGLVSTISQGLLFDCDDKVRSCWEFCSFSYSCIFCGFNSN